MDHRRSPSRSSGRSYSDKTTSPTSPMTPRNRAPGLPRRPSLPMTPTSAGPQHAASSSRSQSIQTSHGFIPTLHTRVASISEQTSAGIIPRFVPPPESLMKGLESTTSSSLMHGLNMILIMLTTLGAFICSVVQDACEEAYTMHKCNWISASFSLINIAACITFFVMYFLHLVGQCDYISWSARRKVTMELMGTLFLLLAIVTVTILVYLKTPAWSHQTTMNGIILAACSVLFITFRILLLAREIPMLLSKPVTHQSSVLTTRTQETDTMATPSPPIMMMRDGDPAVVLQQPRKRSSKRRKRLSSIRSFSLKRTSIANTIDMESGIPCSPRSPTVTFTRMAMLNSDDFLPSQTDSARSSITVLQDAVFRSSSETEDRVNRNSRFPF